MIQTATRSAIDIFMFPTYIHTYTAHTYTYSPQAKRFTFQFDRREREKRIFHDIYLHIVLCVWFNETNKRFIYNFTICFCGICVDFFFFISPNIFALPYISQSLSISHYERSLPSWCFNKKRNSFFGCSVLAMIGICVQFCKGISVAWNDLHCSAKL